MPPNAAFAPFDVTYNWTEHRDGRFVTRSHNKRDERPPHRYRLNVTGRRDPTENRVQINWPAFSRDGTTLRQGYPDGTQVGPAFELAKVSPGGGRTSPGRDPTRRGRCAGPPCRQSCASRARACFSVAVSSRPRDRAGRPMERPGSWGQKIPLSSDSAGWAVPGNSNGRSDGPGTPSRACPASSLGLRRTCSAPRAPGAANVTPRGCGRQEAPKVARSHLIEPRVEPGSDSERWSLE